MPSLKMKQFLNEVLSYIKFSFDRDDIQSELEDHISEKMDYYMEQGYDLDTAEELSVKDMGDAKEIGVELNKQHNPIVGWIWIISNFFVFIFSITVIFSLVSTLFYSVINNFPDYDIPKSEIVYRLSIDEKVKIDDRVIHFTDVLYLKNGELNIFYKSYDTRLWGMGWSLSSIGTISDNLGNSYFGGSSSSGGYSSKHKHVVEGFSGEADTLIINYDHYNRKFRVEIPLKAGAINE